MTAKEIRNDLYDIRYYHTHRGMFNKPGMILVKSTVEEKAERYEKIVKDGGAMPYALYTELYVEGNTQKRTAEKWQVKEGYVKYMNRKLIAYLEKEINAGGQKQ